MKLFLFVQKVNRITSEIMVLRNILKRENKMLKSIHNTDFHQIREY